MDRRTRHGVSSCRLRWAGPGAVTAALASAAIAQPGTSAWPVGGPDDTVAVAAAAVSGWYAAGDSFEDSVEIRDERASLLRVITRADIQGLLPWMTLTGGPDGPCGLAWSDSGRVLYIMVQDAAAAPDGQGSDAVLRYDASSDSLGVFARLELFGNDTQWPHLACAPFKGRLYVGTSANGVAVYSAPSSGATGTLLGMYALPGAGAVHGLTVDRDNQFLFAASETGIYRATLTSLPLVFTLVGNSSGVRAIAFGDHYGGTTNRGLYVLRSPGVSSTSQLDFVPAAQMYGGQPFAPATYLTSASEWHDVAAMSDGRLLVGADEDAVVVNDLSDSRLSFDAWMADEFQQVVTFSKGLISPDGEPAGWVIDGDVVPGASRFHPATPDGAAWAVCALLANDRLTGDPAARPLVRQILTRYAGLAPDGIAPSRTADGVFRHWIDPFTGQAKAGWDPEFATLSTMLIVAAAARAADFYPADGEICRAAARIIFQVRNWDAYLQAGSAAMYFKGLPAGGPDLSLASPPFHEGLVFAEQASVYGASSQDEYAHWLDRANLPSASYLPGRPITSNAIGGFEAAFTSLYPMLLSHDFRAITAWQSQIQNIRWSSGAWTDDNGPRYLTVFSAGTTRSDWGGYSADSLGGHPGNVTTFTSLMAFGGAYALPEAVGAYEAYRKGAREAFKTGASILYRRSDVDRTYTPNSAGLPDVVLGGLGLAELMQPGLIDTVLARPYPSAPPCTADWDRNGAITPADVAAFVADWSLSLTQGTLRADVDGNRRIEPADLALFVSGWFGAISAGC